MSELEILATVVKTLESIQVPVQYTETIAIPIINSSNLLRKLYSAIVNQVKEQDAKKAEPEEVKEEVPEENAEEVKEETSEENTEEFPEE